MSAEREHVAYALDPSTIRSYLSERRILAPDDAAKARVEVLAGGVSCDVLLVECARTAVVVKQALGRLRVEQEWLATPDRAGAESDALRLAAEICPGSVPAVLASVPEDFLVVLERAPGGCVDWKSQLLAGRTEAVVGSRLGSLLGAWHGATASDRAVRARFGDLSAFVQLRIDPYHRSIAMRHPDVAERIEFLAEALVGPGRCLVHGDFSPKNILVGGATLWVIDWEVAHFGDPVFDLAFALCHLRLKAAHRPLDASGYRAVAEAFLHAYRQVATELAAGITESVLVGHTACLLLARVDGKSPAEYLRNDERDQVRSLARTLLRAEHPSLDEMWGI